MLLWRVYQKMNKTQKVLQKFISKTNLKVGDILSFNRYREITNEVNKEFGEEVLQYFMDCFAPMGEPVDPGYEDSLEEYEFVGLEE